VSEFAGLTVEAARRHLAGLLRARAVDTPDLDARLLTGSALGLDLTGLAVSAARVLDAAEGARLDAFARRRAAGEPVARILGVREFWGLTLSLSPATLVPRPDTETVVEAAVELVRAADLVTPRRVLDIGTGSGALLLALLTEFPDAFGVGADIDGEALLTAADNAHGLGLGPRTAFVRGDYGAAFAGGAFDLVVSNPPYIRSSEIGDLAAEVRDHDPRRALDGGPDGLDAYRRIVPQAAALLAPGGALLLEVGQDQSEAVDGLVAAAGLILLPPRRDLAGVARVVRGRNRGPQGRPGQ
jgi:release factor glutamine methyltransferase